jgi:hypothetical protein
MAVREQRPRKVLAKKACAAGDKNLQYARVPSVRR